MDSETEQRYKAETAKINIDYWNDPGNTKTKDRLLKKFGSKEEAMEKTFAIFWSLCVSEYEIIKIESATR